MAKLIEEKTSIYKDGKMRADVDTLRCFSMSLLFLVCATIARYSSATSIPQIESIHLNGTFETYMPVAGGGTIIVQSNSALSNWYDFKLLLGTKSNYSIFRTKNCSHHTEFRLNCISPRLLPNLHSTIFLNSWIGSRFL